MSLRLPLGRTEPVPLGRAVAPAAVIAAALSPPPE
jgi:hypothetical protein